MFSQAEKRQHPRLLQHGRRDPRAQAQFPRMVQMVF